MTDKKRLYKSNFIDKTILHMIIYGSYRQINSIKNVNKKKHVYLMSWIYALTLIVMVLLSFVTLILPIDKIQHRPILFTFFELVVFAFLAIDYSLRWYISDIQDGQKGKLPFILFPFKPLSIMLLLQMVPVLYIINIQTTDNDSPIWVVLRVLKLTRILRIIMIGTLVPFLTIFQIIIEKNRKWLTLFFLLFILTILIFAVGVYNAETSYYDRTGIKPKPNGIANYWDAIYYCTIAITTIGFGDIQVVSTLAKTLTLFMAFLGIMMLSFPAGILAGSFIREVRNMKSDETIWKSDPKKKIIKFDTEHGKNVSLIKEVKKDLIDSDITKD